MSKLNEHAPKFSKLFNALLLTAIQNNASTRELNEIGLEVSNLVEENERLKERLVKGCFAIEELDNEG